MANDKYRYENIDFPGTATGVETIGPELNEQLYARHAEIKSLEDLAGLQRGTPIPALFNQFYKFIQNPSSVSVETFKRMIDTDDTIGSGMDFLTTCLAARIGRYQHDSEEITEWMNLALDRVKGGWFNVVKELLSAAWAGFCVQEKVWANTEIGFIVDKFVSLPPVTILFETDRSGEMTDDGILQYQRNYNPFVLGRGINFFGGIVSANLGFTTSMSRPDAFAKFGDLPFPLRTANTYNYLSIRIPKMKCVHYAFDAQGKFGNPYGRPVSLDTPIPTPTGWTTMRDIEIGNVVFDENGRQKTVSAKSEIFRDRKCFRITFSNGSQIIADKNHLWSVTSESNRRRSQHPRILTTIQLAELNKKYNHSFSCGEAQPLNLEDKDLLIDPYVLGYWLGNGTSSKAELTCHDQDAMFIAAKVDRAGYKCKVYAPDQSLTRRICPKGLKKDLITLGVINKKEIPVPYLFGSIGQRLSLLQGLMDSDGHCPRIQQRDRSNVFSNTNLKLIRQVHELVTGLGGIARINPSQKTGAIGGIVRNRRIVARQDGYTVRFFLRYPAFKLNRKLKNQDFIYSDRKYHHFIKSIDEVQNTDTQCIEVDSESHLFLCGTGMVPTHNSLLRRAYKFYVMKDAFLQMLSIALDRKGTPLTVVFADPNTTIINSDLKGGQTARDRVVGIRADEAARQAFEKIHNDTVIILPGKKGQIYETDFVPQDSNSEAFISAINLCNKSIMRALLVPALIFGDGDGTGSFALAETHSRTFDKILDGMLAGLKQTLLDQVVKELLAYNFPRATWEKKGLGDFAKRDMTMSEKQAEMEVFEKAVNMGIVDSNDLGDLNKMRDMIGFEPRDVAPEEKAVPETIGGINGGDQEKGFDGGGAFPAARAGDEEGLYHI